MSQLLKTGSAFSWSSPFTSGGTSPQGSVGPNEGATASIQVYAAGTNSAPNSLIYTPGSAVVTLSTPLPVGTANLNIEYTRWDGDVIQVENTPDMLELALVSHGTGRQQQFTDQSSNGAVATSNAGGLQLAVQVLFGFSTPPSELTFDTYRAGLAVGMLLPVQLTVPQNAALLINATAGTAPNLPAWSANTFYTEGHQIEDPNGNIQIVSIFPVVSGGVSGPSPPTWNTVQYQPGSGGGNTTDGTINWVNLGPAQPTPAFWVVESLDGNMEPVKEPLYLPDGGGHFRYTVKCINVAEIGSWLDFWMNSSGGPGGGGA